MSGSRETAKKTAETNKRKYGESYYKDIQLLSVKKWKENGRKPRGLAALSPEKRREISSLGGKVSRRPKHDTGNTV